MGTLVEKMFDNGTVPGYEWRAVGKKVKASYAPERAMLGEHAGTTIAVCFSPEHAQIMAASLDLALALIAARGVFGGRNAMTGMDRRPDLWTMVDAAIARIEQTEVSSG